MLPDSIFRLPPPLVWACVILVPIVVSSVDYLIGEQQGPLTFITAALAFLFAIAYGIDSFHRKRTR